MDLDPDQIVEESELDALGIKKKDDALIDDLGDDAVVAADVPEEELEVEEKVDEGIFGDDKGLENYMLTGDYDAVEETY